MWKEFRAFISRGNVVDLAVGVIIGGAFGKIIASFINDIIMPPIGMIIGNVNFKDLKLALGGPKENPVTINYGNFLQVAIEFIIIAFTIFLFIKFINKFKKKEEEAPKVAPEPTKTEVLLSEIRDLLQKK